MAHRGAWIIALAAAINSRDRASSSTASVRRKRTRFHRWERLQLSSTIVAFVVLYSLSLSFLLSLFHIAVCYPFPLSSPNLHLYIFMYLHTVCTFVTRNYNYKNRCTHTHTHRRTHTQTYVDTLILVHKVPTCGLFRCFFVFAFAIVFFILLASYYFNILMPLAAH